MKTKAGVVKQLEFVRDIYDKLKNAGFYKNKEEYSLCGVVFISHWAFVTNNHFIVRVHTPDRPPSEIIYYDLVEDDVAGDPIGAGIEPNPEKPVNKSVFYDYDAETWTSGVFEQFNNISIKDFHRFFFDWKENFVIFNKNDILNKFSEIFGRSSAEKMKRFMAMRQYPDQGVIKCKLMTINKPDPEKDIEFEIPIISPSKPTFLSSGYLPPAICTANSFYLYELLNSKCFEKSDFVWMSYNNRPSPINLHPYMHESGSVDKEISIGIAQPIIKYSFKI